MKKGSSERVHASVRGAGEVEQLTTAASGGVSGAEAILGLRSQSL